MKKVYTITGIDNPAQIKDLDLKQGIVTGYFSAFDSKDADGDIIRKGAFSKTISENFGRIKHLLNHNTTQPLGTPQVLIEDMKGLYYESKIGTHSLGVDFLKMVDSGLIKEHSIGFQIVKNTNKKEYNEITEVKLWEGSSLTSWGANGNTPLIGVKSLTFEEQIENILERSKSIEKFCSNSNATDETIQLLLLEQKQLTQIILDLKNTQPINIIEPKEDEKIIETIKQFTNNLKLK